MAINRESIKEPFWSMDESEIFSALKTNLSGLSSEEVAARLKIFGPNVIKERRRLSKIEIALRQFRSLLVAILLLAGIVTVFLGEWIETGVILAAVMVNVIFGFWQENKSETILELLKTYIRVRARVRRGGQERGIDASELVPGDIIRVTQGDRIPVDARLLFVNNLEIDESILTGESLPVEKNVSPLPPAMVLGERKSMIFSGTLVMSGFADAVVTATGSETEFGKIAGLVAEKDRKSTPLQRSVVYFSAYVGVALLIFTLLLFGLGLYFGKGIHDMFIISVAVAVSAIPEGLPIALTVIMAIGVQRLAARNGIVKKLLAVETLGSTSIILTDKTGTLTQAKMELTGIMPYKNNDNDTEDKKDLLSYALVNTDVVIENPQDVSEKWIMSGRALEVSLVKGAALNGVLLTKVLEQTKILDRLPFDSKHKFSAAVFKTDSVTHLALFGAPEIILRLTVLTQKEQEKMITEIEKRAFAGERVLGVASRLVSEGHENVLRQKNFNGLNFDGLITFRDPLRPHVSQAVNEIAAAGVKTIIVTGDHRGTAEAVARELGLVDGKGAVLTGDDLMHLTKEELEARSREATLYARVTPEQKVMIAKLYQERGEVVAVTGDGINDAPALHTADIGVAVGSGTDVAKSAADLIILDDNFETIVAAIKEGRRILRNIRKVIIYLLSNSFDELFLIGGAIILGIALPINALQILFVNLFSDSFPAIAFAFEDSVDDPGNRPHKLHKNLFDREMKFFILIIGVLSSAFLFILYLVLLKIGFAEELTRTFIFASFASYALLLAFSLRSLGKSILSYNPLSNRPLTIGVSIGLLSIIAAIYIPWLQQIFNTSPLPPVWLLGVAGVGLLNISAVEFGKWLFRKKIIKFI
ncbi:MAG: HAD-IC family P-type ATPase [Parcubacteria group bacterium]|nr:HAD-IC family P-type ATPase [Parcubacteria group bacterium]